MTKHQSEKVGAFFLNLSLNSVWSILPYSGREAFKIKSRSSFFNFNNLPILSGAGLANEKNTRVPAKRTMK